MIHNGQQTAEGFAQLRDAQLIAQQLADSVFRAECFSKIAITQWMLGLDATTCLISAKKASSEENDLDRRARAFCAVAIAESEMGRNPTASLRMAEAALPDLKLSYGHVSVALTRAQLGQSPDKHLEKANAMAAEMEDRWARDETFGHIARIEARMGRFDASRLTAERIQSSSDLCHTHCEIAIAESEAGRDPAHSLEAAARVAALAECSLAKVESYSFLAVGFFLSKRNALPFLQVALDVAGALQNPVEIAAANSQLASAMAQIGDIDGAKCRSELMAASSYRDAAYKSIASEEARSHRFGDAKKTTKRIERTFFCDCAMKAIAIAESEFALRLVATYPLGAKVDPEIS